MKLGRICILGGTGFVGHHLINRLAKTGRELRILTRHRERHRDLLVLPRIDIIDADVHDPATLVRHFTGCDAVINLVGILNDRSSGGRGFQRQHVELPGKIIQACQDTGITRLLHMSALRAHPTQRPSYYLRSKGEGESLVLGSQKRGLAPTVFRPSVIFGDGDHFINRFARLVHRAPYVMPLPMAEVRFAPVFAGDVAEAYLRALEDKNSIGRSFELCGPRVYTLRQILAYIAATARLRRKIIGLGPGASHLAAALLEYVPGHPLSLDNYHSMQVDNVCGEDGYANGLEVLGISATPLETVVPALLKQGGFGGAARFSSR